MATIGAGRLRPTALLSLRKVRRQGPQRKRGHEDRRKAFCIKRVPEQGTLSSFCQLLNSQPSNYPQNFSQNSNSKHTNFFQKIKSGGERGKASRPRDISRRSKEGRPSRRRRRTDDDATAIDGSRTWRAARRSNRPNRPLGSSSPATQ